MKDRVLIQNLEHDKKPLSVKIREAILCYKKGFSQCDVHFKNDIQQDERFPTR